MKQTIEENKKSILLDLLSQLQNDFSQHLSNIENDTHIPDASWDSIDQNSTSIFGLFLKIREEIIFS